jgi:hypothetical protein
VLGEGAVESSQPVAPFAAALDSARGAQAAP